MPLSSSLNAAASGLRGYSMRFDTHSQNLASAGAIGGKKRFTHLSSNNSDSSTSYFTPSGIQGKPMINIARTGTRINVDDPLNMALTGESFFVTSKSADNANPGNYEFTRTGTFQKDKDNNVVNHLGQYLKYFPYDPATGTFASANTTTLDATQTLNVAAFSGMPQATSMIDLGVSLPGNAALNNVNSNTFTVYDSLGGNHTLSFRWEKTAQVASTSQTWNLQVSTATGTVAAPYIAGVDIVFDGGGLPVTFNGAAAMPNIDIVWPTGAGNSSIALGLGTVGQSNGVTAGGGDVFSTTSQSINGYRSGKLKDVMIAHNGEVTISFDTGATALTIGRIPLATFASTNSLLESDGNSYTQTSESGNYLLEMPGTGGKVGDIKHSHLEESTVDAADVFGDMIIDSKRYTGNLKTISTIEKMLDSLERAVM